MAACVVIPVALIERYPILEIQSGMLTSKRVLKRPSWQWRRGNWESVVSTPNYYANHVWCSLHSPCTPPWLPAHLQPCRPSTIVVPTYLATTQRTSYQPHPLHRDIKSRGLTLPPGLTMLHHTDPLPPPPPTYRQPISRPHPPHHHYVPPRRLSTTSTSLHTDIQSGGLPLFNRGKMRGSCNVRRALCCVACDPNCVRAFLLACTYQGGLRPWRMIMCTHCAQLSLHCVAN